MDARTMVVTFKNCRLNGLFLNPQTLKTIASTQDTRTNSSCATNMLNDDTGAPHFNTQGTSRGSKHSGPAKHETQSTKFFMRESCNGATEV